MFKSKYYVICKKHQELGCILIRYVKNLKEAQRLCVKDKELFFRRVVNGSKT